MWKSLNDYSILLFPKASSEIPGRGLRSKTRFREQKILFSRSTNRPTRLQNHTRTPCESAVLTQGLIMTVTLSEANTQTHDGLMVCLVQWLVLNHSVHMEICALVVRQGHKHNLTRSNAFTNYRQGPALNDSPTLFYNCVSENSHKFNVNARY